MKKDGEILIFSSLQKAFFLTREAELEPGGEDTREYEYARALWREAVWKGELGRERREGGRREVDRWSGAGGGKRKKLAKGRTGRDCGGCEADERGGFPREGGRGFRAPLTSFVGVGRGEGDEMNGNWEGSWGGKGERGKGGERVYDRKQVVERYSRRESTLYT